MNNNVNSCILFFLFAEQICWERFIWSVRVCVFLDRRCVQAHNDDDNGDEDDEWGSIRIFFFP